MHRYTGGFPFEEPEWVQLVVSDPEGAERAAQQIADRGGEEDPQYAEAVYPELRTVQERAAERGAAPVAVYVPDVRPAAPPLVPATAFMMLQEPPEAGRTLDALSALAREPRGYRLQEPEVRTVELPLGPACRVRELAYDGETADGREVLVEYLTHHVLSPVFPEGVVEFTVSWTPLALGPAMLETADEMAAGLTLSAGRDG
ncbi:hypothetical protein [Streptomyces sp. YIM 98790]|uniref:hypothetical protein n=1 Tax=Streptomyces sp. YIM 98790 TaxID=2689077 RepID=UPI00140750D3|nr:hypothetical protein [Streptomyces sp. YIM 98790]